jgi:hypothetical protein
MAHATGGFLKKRELVVANEGTDCFIPISASARLHASGALKSIMRRLAEHDDQLGHHGEHEEGL